MKTQKQVERRIAQLKAKIDRTQAILDAPREYIPGPFVTGRSNYPKSLSRRLDAQNERYGKLFKENQAAKREYDMLVKRLELIKAGEVHPNGQPRKDAPSRIRRESASLTLADFFRSLIKPGDSVALVFNPRNTITIKRVNAKTVTDEMGEKWKYDEIIPIKDGQPIDLLAAYRIWKSEQAA